MSVFHDAFKGFDPNSLDVSTAGNWPIGVKIVSYVLLMAVIVVGGWYYYATDKKVNLEREVAKEKGLKDSFQNKAFQVANLEALRKQMADVEEKFSELLKQLPTDKEVPGLLDDITLIGTDSGLNIGSIGLASERKQEFYVELPINISVQGSYHQIGQFVSGIAALPRIVTLHNYSIKPTKGEVSMSISAKTYRYDDEQ
ncbi:type 4a pilus biogenesis protein PilO [uncultured Neptuniibacter sp.]|uniref:type 4a pilus biogenesis protein PilO n=1 Tax=uncultured Neptuniibacter sp. TaxID=502143 RepID=UPI00261D9C3E|nr:type 4a pilus biogenesis protein PilO [uncultured Neptuniibacter sp.]